MILLERLRRDQLLTPEELGEEVGLAGGTIRRLEQGKGARMETLRKLSAWAEVSAYELLEDIDSQAAA